MKSNLPILFFFLPICFTAYSQENPYQAHADKLFYSGEYERAFRSYGNAIKADKPEDNNYLLFLNAADCAVHLNFKQIALSYYGLSAQRHVPAQELINHIKNVYCQKDVLCTAEKLKEIIAKHPEAYTTLYPEIASILYNYSEYEKAIPMLKESLILHPNNYLLQKMLAECYFNLGDTENAYFVYKEILKYNDQDYDSYIFLGNYYFISANKHIKLNAMEEEKRNKYFSSKNKDEERTLSDISFEYYHKAGEYLEKAYSLYNSDELKKSLIQIYTITGNKEKLALFKK
jgi:tetratricopeptide (TPR) repeat protein